MTDKVRTTLKDYVINDGMITGLTEGGQNIMRRILHQEPGTVETSDFIFTLEDPNKSGVVEKAKEMVEDIREKVFGHKEEETVGDNTSG